MAIDSSSLSLDGTCMPPEVDGYPEYADEYSSTASSLILRSETPITEPSLSDETSSNADSTQDFFGPETRGQFVMVVGGLGYIGSHTTLELLKEGYNVVVIDNLSNSYETVLTRVSKLAKEHCDAHGGKLPAVRFHEMDYRSPTMRDILASYAINGSSGDCSSQSKQSAAEGSKSRISGVIHFAAHKSVEESISKPLPYYQNNVCGLVDFLVLLQEFGIRNFVFSSSATVYGTKTNEGKPLKEEDVAHHPVSYTDANGEEVRLLQGVKGLASPYGRTKYFSEAILADVAYSDPSWKITALRYFNPVGCHESGILGEDPRQKPTNLFPVIGRVLTGDKDVLDVFGSDWETHDGTAVRDFIHVVDLARGHIAALVASARGKIPEPFRAYNLGTGKGATVTEVINSVREAAAREIPVRHAGRRAGDVGYCVAATHRVEKELAWKADTPLLHCARDMWNYLQNMRNPDRISALTKSCTT